MSACGWVDYIFASSSKRLSQVSPKVSPVVVGAGIQPRITVIMITNNFQIAGKTIVCLCHFRVSVTAKIMLVVLHAQSVKEVTSICRAVTH
mgnify:CR=1 FL=1